MYKASRNRRRKGLTSNKTLLFISVTLLLIVFSLILSNAFIFKDKKVDSKQIAKDNKKEISQKAQNDAQDGKIKEVNSQTGTNDKQEVDKSAQDTSTSSEQQEDKTAYKKGTSHNIEASTWAYKTKDVNNWILKPATYTGTDKLVFLTFDDGPSAKYTNRVLDTLKEKGVHATFFVVGTSAIAPDAKPILERQIKEGHSVGLHSFSHNYSHLYPSRVGNVNNVLGEIKQNIEAIQKSLGTEFTSTVFRYPGGHMSWKGLSAVDTALANKNIYNIDWNLLTGDAEPRGSAMSKKGALQNLKEQMSMYNNPKVAVILMHDIHAKSVDALPEIIDYYKSLGYKFGILE